LEPNHQLLKQKDKMITSSHLEVEFARAVNTPIFCGLSLEQRTKVKEVMKAQQFLPGAKIVSQGEENHKLFIILHGTADVTQTSPNWSGNRTINKLSTNDFFGELSLLREDSMTTATVRASSHMTCAIMPQGQFMMFRDIFEDVCMQRATTKHALAENTSTQEQERLCDFATAASHLIADEQLKTQKLMLEAAALESSSKGFRSASPDHLGSLLNQKSLSNIKAHMKQTPTTGNAWKKRQSALQNKLAVLHMRRSSSKAGVMVFKERVSSNRKHLMTEKVSGLVV
jgi:CRP-like cAMP-binding protein